jgi:hypothetical protein
MGKVGRYEQGHNNNNIVLMRNNGLKRDMALKTYYSQIN